MVNDFERVLKKGEGWLVGKITNRGGCVVCGKGEDQSFGKKLSFNLTFDERKVHS